jgi:ABC-2 type transport system permease protein
MTSATATRPPVPTDPAPGPPAPAPALPVGALVAFGAFELLRLLRSWKFLAITVGFPVIFYMLFLGDHKAGTVVDGQVTWRVYLMISMCSFGALIAALNASGSRLSMERASGWARQLRVTPIPAWSYIGVKVAASMLVLLPVLALVEIVGSTFGGVQLGLGTWFELTGLLFVTALPFAILGVVVGFLVSPEAAFPVATGLMFVLGYFGGLFNPVDQMPAALRVVAQILPSYHQASLGIALVDGQGLRAVDWLVLAGYALGLGLVVLWRHRVEEARGIA